MLLFICAPPFFVSVTVGFHRFAVVLPTQVQLAEDNQGKLAEFVNECRCTQNMEVKSLCSHNASVCDIIIWKRGYFLSVKMQL